MSINELDDIQKNVVPTAITSTAQNCSTAFFITPMQHTRTVHLEALQIFYNVQQHGLCNIVAASWEEEVNDAGSPQWSGLASHFSKQEFCSQRAYNRATRVPPQGTSNV